MARNLPLRSAAILAFSFGLMPAGLCAAATLQVSVMDAQGKPVADILITASQIDATAHSAPQQSSGTAVMDQVNKEFVPEMLVVRTGTTVSFPNSDSVAHQVYSFSATKRFSLPLYRGKPYPPVVFDNAGVVTLGCNIHDHMVGYIVVTDTLHFGQTNTQGLWSRELLPGTYRIRAWHPRLNESIEEQTIVVAEAGATSLRFTLAKTLRPRSRSPNDKRIRDY